ncbi:hypothetical protein ATN83_2001 [Raoultella ornithinolytica]|nr:hypothetical protein ATN83_2001 [Raoultella ornithinolytica]
MTHETGSVIKNNIFECSLASSVKDKVIFFVISIKFIVMDK